MGPLACLSLLSIMSWTRVSTLIRKLPLPSFPNKKTYVVYFVTEVNGEEITQIKPLRILKVSSHVFDLC